MDILSTPALTGIKKVAGETKHLRGYNGYVQVIYDPEANKVDCIVHRSINSWNRLEDPCPYYTILNTKYPLTMKDVKRAVHAFICDDLETIKQQRRFTHESYCL